MLPGECPGEVGGYRRPVSSRHPNEHPGVAHTPAEEEVHMPVVIVVMRPPVPVRGQVTGMVPVP